VQQQQLKERTQTLRIYLALFHIDVDWCRGLDRRQQLAYLLIRVRSLDMILPKPDCFGG
jgi:hypothetical protein